MWGKGKGRWYNLDINFCSRCICSTDNNLNDFWIRIVGLYNSCGKAHSPRWFWCLDHQSSRRLPLRPYPRTARLVLWQAGSWLSQRWRDVTASIQTTFRMDTQMMNSLIAIMYQQYAKPYCLLWIGSANHTWLSSICLFWLYSLATGIRFATSNTCSSSFEACSSPIRWKSHALHGSFSWIWIKV